MAEGASITSVVLAGVLGGIVGAALVSLHWVRRGARASRLETRREVIASWLAARIAMGRASVSFVTAFRSLASVSPESAYFSLRQDEAQRARAQWARALGELDVADARLRIWCTDRDLTGKMAELDRISIASIRAAIDGDEADADRIFQSLVMNERRAIALAESAIGDDRHRAQLKNLNELYRRVVTKLESVADGWTRDES